MLPFCLLLVIFPKWYKIIKRRKIMFGIIIAALVLILLFRCLCIVPQAQQYVIEFLGKYNCGIRAKRTGCD